MKELGGYVYILSNKINTVLYIRVTEDLIKRIYEHKQKFVGGFSKKYNLNKLVYYERFETIIEAIEREKQLKNWKRDWKIDLIIKINPEFNDLYQEII